MRLRARRTGELLVLTPKLGDFRRLYRWKAGTLTPVTPTLKWDVAGFSLDHGRHAHPLHGERGRLHPPLRARRPHLPAASRLPKLPGRRPRLRRRHHPRRPLHRRSRSIRATRRARAASTTGRPGRSPAGWCRAPPRSTPAASPAPRSRRTRPATARRSPPSSAARPAASRRRARWSSSSTAGRRDRRSRASAPAPSSSSTPATCWWSPTCAAATGYGKTWLRRRRRAEAAARSSPTSRTPRAGPAQAFAAGGVAPKVGIMGGSYGGYSTLIGMTMFAGAYDAGVSNVGISNLVTFLENTAPYRRILRDHRVRRPREGPRGAGEALALHLRGPGEGAAAHHPGGERSARAGRRGHPDPRRAGRAGACRWSCSSSPTRGTARRSARTWSRRWAGSSSSSRSG